MGDWSTPEQLCAERLSFDAGDPKIGPMEIELAPGYTWIVAYRWDGEEPEQMLVRAISPERALKEAHYALEIGELDYQIFGLVREGKHEALC